LKRNKPEFAVWWLAGKVIDRKTEVRAETAFA